MNEEKSLTGKEALDKVKEIVEGTSTCFFCSDIKTGVPLSIRPMVALEVDEEGNIWFMSKRDSDTDEEVEHDPFVHLLFQQEKGNGFLNIYGISEIQTDKEKIRQLWKEEMSVWFNGPNDATIILLKVNPLKGHYWDHAHGVVAVIKMAAANLAGKGYPDQVEGDLNF